MKSIALLLALSLALPLMRANLYIPKAKLAGETVHVRMLKDVAAVTAVFEFESWDTRDAKILYFPLFAGEGIDPVRLLASSGFELEIGGKELAVAAPCAAPEGFPAIAKSPRVYWFAVNLDALASAEEMDGNHRIVIKASYSQPLIRGRFYYLPVITGQGEPREARAWRYQMHVYSAARVTQVFSRDTDHETLAGGVVVYLRDGEVVEVQ